MQIIPVIDLKNGITVHAKQGKRDQYAPLTSTLCPTTGILELIDAFRQLFAINTVYVADLDAITNQGENTALINQCLENFPELNFWIDSGYFSSDNPLLPLPNYMPVLGSESFNEANVFEIQQFDQNFILSLDYSQCGKMGATALFNDTTLWPENIIIMTLPRVGSSLGPDFDTLAAYSTRHPDHVFIAAGGIRNKQDLVCLSEIGINHALIATALHDGSIHPEDIAGLQTKKYPD